MIIWPWDRYNQRKKIPYPEPLDPGNYEATLTDIPKVGNSKTKPGIFHVQLVFTIGDRKIFHYMAGYLPMIHFMFDHRELFIGKQYKLRIGIREYDDQKFNEVKRIERIND